MNLSIMKSALPEFDITKFNIFNEILSLKWESMIDEETGEEAKYLTLEMRSSNNYKILMECKNVDSFRFRGNGLISGFYIKDMSVMGYESGAKYEVGDYENEDIEFYCSDVVVKNAEKIRD